MSDAVNARDDEVEQMRSVHKEEAEIRELNLRATELRLSIRRNKNHVGDKESPAPDRGSII